MSKYAILLEVKERWLTDGSSPYICDNIDKVTWETENEAEGNDLCQEVAEKIEYVFSVPDYLVKLARTQPEPWLRAFADTRFNYGTRNDPNSHPIVQAYRLGMLEGLIAKYKEIENVQL